MLIGNTWIKNAKLRILNGFVIVPATPTWITFGETLQLNHDEEGITVGFQQLLASSANGVLEMQILYNHTAAHEGYFRTSTDNGPDMEVRIGNQQPTTMPMPMLDVPPSTLIGMRARFNPGTGVNLYLDLYVVTYYRSEQAWLKPECFPTDQQPMPQV